MGPRAGRGHDTARARDAARRVALVGETLDQVRAVMVEGDSGILEVTPPDRRPDVKLGQNKMIWPNGAEAMLVSAVNPEALRGPQFDCAWSDELAKWRRCREAWTCCNSGSGSATTPRQIVTTTPRDNPVLVEIMEMPGTVITHAGTAANRANLAPGFLERLAQRYGGTALGRQEIEGELVRGHEGALWQPEMIEAARWPRHPRSTGSSSPSIRRDPGTAGRCLRDRRRRGGRRRPARHVGGLCAGGSDRRGRRPAGLGQHGRHGLRGLRRRPGRGRVNQGGDLVESVLRQVAPQISYRAVRAQRGKRLRAEPVAALYEQGRVHHVGLLPALEDQMCAFTGAPLAGGRSPDRLDALVWAITDLVLDGPGGVPRVRQL